MRTAIEFYVEGKPTGKARARTVNNHGHIHSYTPQKTKDYEAHIRSAYRNRAHTAQFRGAVEVTITALFTVPKSYSKKLQQELIGKPYLKKPDADNICKAVLDALNGTAWADDAAVYSVKVIKRYATVDGITVALEGETDLY